jgi:hypothetical protein
MVRKVPFALTVHEHFEEGDPLRFVPLPRRVPVRAVRRDERDEGDDAAAAEQARHLADAPD